MFVFLIFCFFYPIFYWQSDTVFTIPTALESLCMKKIYTTLDWSKNRVASAKFLFCRMSSLPITSIFSHFRIFFFPQLIFQNSSVEFTFYFLSPSDFFQSMTVRVMLLFTTVVALSACIFSSFFNPRKIFFEICIVNS